jgi:hypothetical protein
MGEATAGRDAIQVVLPDHALTPRGSDSSYDREGVAMAWRATDGDESRTSFEGVAMARLATHGDESRTSFDAALWRTLQRAAAGFIPPSGQWWHKCHHGTLKRAPQARDPTDPARGAG